MPNHEIKTRFRLEGEQQYRAAMKDAADAIKVLNAEEKLAKAQFEETGDAQQYAADQARILKEKIEEQKKIVEAAESAVRALAEKGFSQNSKEMQAWRTKLINANTALSKMETKLRDTESELRDQSSVLNKAKNAMTRAETKVKSLTAEEKLAEAQFKNTGDQEAYAADKTRILKEKVEAQKVAVNAAEEAIKSMTDNGVDPASAEMVEWKEKLADAKTKLANMETALADAEKELKDQTGELGNAKTAMDNAETKIKSLTAEEKLAEAQFKATGDQEAYAAEKTRILEEKVEAQKKAVEAAEKAIKSMTDNGVDPASAEMVEWKEKLADAKTKLANMETALADAEKELKDQTGELGNAKTAMDNAETKIKSLTAEEKLAEAQFKATGDQEAYAAEKTRILEEKVEAQKKAVEAAEKAIKSMTDNGVDPNAEEMVEWKNKLVEAKTKLANMETALNNVGTELGEETEAFGEATGGADDLKKSIDKVGEKVDFQNIISSIDDLTSHIENTVKAVGRVSKRIWEFETDAGKWADDIATAAAQMSIDPETYQSWQYASQFIDTNVTDITKSWQDIQKKLKENNTEYLGELSKLRIGSRRANGTMRSSEEIFWDIIDALHNMKDPTEQARVATEMFGNDWRNLKPLIDAGSGAYKELAKEGLLVAVVSNENVEKLGKLDDAMNKTKSQANKLKNDALAALSPAFVEVAEAGGKAMGALDEFLQSAEGKQAVSDLNAAIVDLINAFLGEDGGKGTFKAVIDTAKDAVKGFTDGLKWIADNGETVKTIIAGLGIVWGALKVSKGVLEFMTLLQAIPLDKLLAVFSSKGAETVASAAGKAAEKAAGGAAAKSAFIGGSGAAPAIPSEFGSIAAGLGGTALIGYGWYKAIEARQGDQSKLIDTAEHLAASTEGNKELLKAFEEFVRTQDAMEKAWTDFSLTDDDLNEIIDKANEASEAFLAMEDAGKVLDAYNSWRTGNSINMKDWILPENWEELATDAMGGLKKGLDEGMEGVEESGTNIGQALIDKVKAALDEHSPSKVMEVIGENASVGLANGIYNRADEAIQAAQWLADQVAATFQNALDIHSPSGVFYDFGEFTGTGYASGLEHSLAAVERAVGKMVGTVTRRPVQMIGGLSYAASAVPAAMGAGRYGSATSSPDMIHVTLAVDGEDLADIMTPLINGKIGAIIQSTRR